jgi:hypothetical protein
VSRTGEPAIALPQGRHSPGEEATIPQRAGEAAGEAASATFVSSLSRSLSVSDFRVRIGGSAPGNLPLPLSRASVPLGKGVRLDRGTEVGGGIGVCCLRLWPPQDGGDKEEANCVYDPGPKRLVR